MNSPLNWRTRKCNLGHGEEIYAMVTVSAVMAMAVAQKRASITLNWERKHESEKNYAGYKVGQPYGGECGSPIHKLTMSCGNWCSKS